LVVARSISKRSRHLQAGGGNDGFTTTNVTPVAARNACELVSVVLLTAVIGQTPISTAHGELATQIWFWVVTAVAERKLLLADESVFPFVLPSVLAVPAGGTHCGSSSHWSVNCLSWARAYVA
jgi:hypothetical protein